MKKLVAALDVLSSEKAVKIAKDIVDYVDEFKVNYPLVLSAGIKVIKDLSKIRPVIADFKIADVPHLAYMISKIAFESGALAVIVHGFSGSDSVKATLDVARDFDGKVYVVTELSSKGGEEYMTKFSVDIAKMAKKLGCHGIIAPATRVEKVKILREVVGKMEILCPGVGFQGGSFEVLKFADGIIVGRSIYESEDPKKSAREIREIINKRT
ncbi:MAG: orotidine-5'-phosphate decarboxylase [Archaeoglobaceae archaeon]|nr:orotidine-5'-phosphate decarboxylase [Archaeoglobaceae archaeon]MCX8152280.1 orotidine-5'-phosphate decarboxylase [Archaeoglobaceae archaeon]MDW8013958.1 orotidine-5'-phosphate decarboxylase [Archaeoglobaceae archaeon]